MAKPGEIQGDVYRMCCAEWLFPKRMERCKSGVNDRKLGNAARKSTELQNDETMHEPC
ncbi:hypothetical protein [uncultured Ruminococcus sp.]|uniref:hypothetical protein n=1 Tax=uncultured Ruminococcus sp. TaxID=165186 RepID=UPI002611E522|nr:hypothetical protein [uncultured Ruminococcus sp.]